MELDQISGLLICFPLAPDQEPRKKNKLRSSKEYQNICQQRPEHSFSHAPLLDSTGAGLRAPRECLLLALKSPEQAIPARTSPSWERQGSPEAFCSRFPAQAEGVSS